jgi:hypothetical protein
MIAKRTSHVKPNITAPAAQSAMSGPCDEGAAAACVETQANKISSATAAN